MSKKGRTRAEDVAINDDGGPAFPYSALQPNEAAIALAGTMYADNVGMTLRDYFAIKSLVAVTNGDHVDGQGDPERHAAMAYVYADAMLRARRRA